MPIHRRWKSTVSLAHAHWPLTNQLNFSRFQEYLYFNPPMRKTKLFSIRKYENEDHVMKRWMHVQALVRFVNERVKDQIDRIIYMDHS